MNERCMLRSRDFGINCVFYLNFDFYFPIMLHTTSKLLHVTSYMLHDLRTIHSKSLQKHNKCYRYKHSVRVPNVTSIDK